jgi:hypothetical protein
MKTWKWLSMGAIGIGVAALALRAGGEVGVSMHELDWEDGAVPVHGRRYRGVGQFLHHQREMSGMMRPAAEIYFARTLSPAFREQIMILTAMSDACGP